jgi:hypothetical protein
MDEQRKSTTLTIDGKPVTVPEGTTVLAACEVLAEELGGVLAAVGQMERE